MDYVYHMNAVVYGIHNTMVVFSLHNYIDMVVSDPQYIHCGIDILPIYILYTIQGAPSDNKKCR